MVIDRWRGSGAASEGLSPPEAQSLAPPASCQHPVRPPAPNARTTWTFAERRIRQPLHRGRRQLHAANCADPREAQPDAAPLRLGAGHWLFVDSFPCQNLAWQQRRVLVVPGVFLAVPGWQASLATVPSAGVPAWDGMARGLDKWESSQRAAPARRAAGPRPLLRAEMRRRRSAAAQRAASGDGDGGLENGLAGRPAGRPAAGEVD